MKTWTALSLGLIWFALGCDVAAVDEAADPEAQNQCDAQKSCPSDGACRDGRCVADSGELTKLVVSVSVPNSSEVAYGRDYVISLDELDPAGGDAPIVLETGTVTGGVFVDPYAPGEGSCVLEFLDDDLMVVPAALDGSIPVTMSLTPSDRVFGLPTPSYATQVTIKRPVQTPPETYPLDLEVPPGEYDLYIQPPKPAPPTETGGSGGCDVPPWLARRVPIMQGENYLYKLPVPATLTLTLRVPLMSIVLEKWTVDMLDPDSGLVISTHKVLAANPNVRDALEYEAALLYYPVAGGSGDELVRLTPPEHVIAPTVTLKRSALELFSKGSGTIDQFTSYPSAVHVEGQVTLAGQAVASSAAVSLVSESIDGIHAGIFASFVRNVTVDADGMFETDLLPGVYQVYAVPGSATSEDNAVVTGKQSALTKTKWEIAASPEVQAGKTIELSPALHVVGRVLTPTGDAAAGAEVQATAAPSEVALFDQPHGEAEASPIAEPTLVDANGAFELAADPGVFDISVRPSQESGFGWYVGPGVGVESDGFDAGLLKLRLPVAYSGTLTALVTKADDDDEAGGAPGSGTEERVVANALIRAYVYLNADRKYTSDPTEAVSVVQVAETRAGLDGTFTLLIPANLN